jgi:chromosome segregation ATPase
MASLDTALNRLAIALDALDARLSSAVGTGKANEELIAQVAGLKAERESMQAEIGRLRGEVTALDDLHDDMSARLDAALREVQAVLTE